MDRQHRIDVKDADKILMAFEHMIRCGCIDGYKELFRQRFSEREKLTADGKVNVHQLARDVLKEMGVDDPVRKFE